MTIHGFSARLVPTGFVVLRAPALPFGMSTGASLAQSTRDPVVQEALWLASPSFGIALERWLEKPRLGRNAGVERALARSLNRMESRPTPFGLLATLPPCVFPSYLFPMPPLPRHDFVEPSLTSAGAFFLLALPPIRRSPQ